MADFPDFIKKTAVLNMEVELPYINGIKLKILKFQILKFECFMAPDGMYNILYSYSFKFTCHQYSPFHILF